MDNKNCKGCMLFIAVMHIRLEFCNAQRLINMCHATMSSYSLEQHGQNFNSNGITAHKKRNMFHWVQPAQYSEMYETLNGVLLFDCSALLGSEIAGLYLRYVIVILKWDYLALYIFPVDEYIFFVLQ